MSRLERITMSLLMALYPSFIWKCSAGLGIRFSVHQPKQRKPSSFRRAPLSSAAFHIRSIPPCNSPVSSIPFVETSLYSFSRA
ncbi:hypothetical protein BDR22DRAFT_605969 [Usnea florida]